MVTGRHCTKFFSEVLIFIQEVIDSHFKLVDVFGHGFCLKVFHSNLNFALFDLPDSCFQAISALQRRNTAVVTYPSKTMSYVS